NVKSFVADNWTFEYDLAFAGLGKEVYIAAKLSKGEEKKDFEDILETNNFQRYEDEYRKNIENESVPEKKASLIYSEFTKGKKASKAISAQYLANILEDEYADKSEKLREKLPKYLLDMFDYLFSNERNF
ncbi:MAG: hypothetical protein KAW93_08875, partial [Methanogenium sp.]|nr:hypothetical protein [Methanogenium sp.]